MSGFNINNFVIDRVLRGLMTSTTDGSLLWSINQITNPSLNISMETADAVDAMGNTLVTFNRSKSAEFTAENSLFDLGLFAAQNGQDKQIATTANKITTPCFETLTVPNPNTDAVVLAHTPKETPAYIYELKGDGTLGAVLTYASTAGTGKFTYNSSAHSITFPTDAVVGSQYFISYEYDSEDAVSVTGNAVDFPRSGKFIMEVLGTDVCDTSALIHAFVIFPNAKLDGNVDISFTTDGTHPFTIQANQAYCDTEKLLFQIIVPEEE